MTANNGILAKLDRKVAISQVDPERHTKLQRAAESLSRRNVDQAVTELLNEAHSRLAVLCYERDDTGTMVNVDEPTGKILIPLPWGKVGHTKWGLTPTEANILRRIMFARQQSGLPLFYFSRNYRAWFLNIKEVARIPDLGEWEIGVGEYRLARQGGRSIG